MTEQRDQGTLSRRALREQQEVTSIRSSESVPSALPVTEVLPQVPAAVVGFDRDVPRVTLHQLAATALAARASDIHLTEGLPALMRVDGSLIPIPGGEHASTAAWFHHTLDEVMTPRQREELADSDEYDLSIEIEAVARFRVNVFRQVGKLAVAMRFIAASTKPFEELGVPAIAGELINRPRGLVLVTGPTGSGKSTTLAAMIDLVNRKRPIHIVTIEDPIEFRHESKMALVHQREIGSDTRSFSEAMRRVLRQDPDIILIGELRDPESISIALTAAETGHLVVSTLHTQSAAKSINRIVDAFAPEQQAQVRSQLGDALQGIITQTLLPKKGESGRVISTEVLVNNPAIANLIREGEVSQIYSMLQSGSSLGMHTLDQDLRRLAERGIISTETAQLNAQDPKTVVEGVKVSAGLLEDAWLAPSEGTEAKGWLD